jgi:diguanylate cyclase (GGDEF)-like protein
MSRVVEYLAELTGHRDRDLLDVTLVGALRDLLNPGVVAVYRCVGEPGQQRWLTRAHLSAGEATATADPLWPDPDTLPTLASEPDRHACLLRQQALVVSGPPAVAYFPLATEREAVGVVELHTGHMLAAEDVRLVSSILRVYRNFQDLLDDSERDMLTGLLNRKTFDENFLRIVLQGTAGAGSLPAAGPRREVPEGGWWLAVIDIDHFKRVNDSHGHLIGDEVLLLLARLMRTNFRFHDHLYRYGGEEFVLLMRCATGADAASALERLRANVEHYPFPQVGHITISIGFTHLRPDDTSNTAFERADQAIYVAKQNGRNRVADHAGLVASGRLSDSVRRSDVELF